MANYPYLILGRDCSLKCVCMVCGIKAADCKYAGCKDCDKITGHKGCQNERKGRAMSKAKVRGCTDSRGDYSMVWIWCPGCDEYHAMPVTKPSNGDGVVWVFNGDEEKPTLSPSILVRHGGDNTVCHSFIADGKIQFLSDSTHGLSGQTVELPEVDM